MLRVRDDDASAFAELMQRYEGRLVRLMHTIGPRHDLAEDLAQETFMRVFRARKTYEPGAKFSTWLFTIAGNVARMHGFMLALKSASGEKLPMGEEV